MAKGPCCLERGCETAEGRKRAYPHIRFAERLEPPCTADRCAWCDCARCLWRTLQALKRLEAAAELEEKERIARVELAVRLRRCWDCGVSLSENPATPPCDCIQF
jgi:hypothetical protein